MTPDIDTKIKVWLSFIPAIYRDYWELGDHYKERQIMSPTNNHGQSAINGNWNLSATAQAQDHA